MKLIIAGTKTFDFRPSSIDTIIAMLNIPRPTEIVCGCGGTDESIASKKITNNLYVSDRGVDLIGEKYADNNGLKIHYIAAKWKQEGKSAGPKRNRKMADLGW